MKKLAVFLTSAIVALAGLSPLAQAEDKPTEIRIAYSGAGTGGRPLSGGTILATANLRGLLEQEFKADGIKVKWNFFPGAGPATNEAFANKLVDFAYHGDLPLIVGRSTGLKHKILLSLGRFGNTYFVVPSDSEAKSLADLKGKRIAVFKGTAAQLTLARVLEKYGYTEKDFKVISMDNDTAKAALATKDIDGYITTPFDLEARGVGKILFQIPRDPKVTSVGTFWVSEDFEKKYPQIVQRVVTALVKEAQWDSDEKNRDQLFKFWGQAGSTPYGDYVKSWQGYTLKERNSPLLDDYYVAALKKAIDESRRFKLVRSNVDINGWLEPKYLNQALKDLKLESYWQANDADGNVKK
ncbi:sulfonate transport system substrate-binding protein [Andreprevotia lacus DSM 23236]|jgi:sulfonate transport system substrate-binding protein|uniref:Sulfonate transport system substrate-binding protein n=1 Tax=Andreprevotia lacus DSM 23236 TaxID=1121001 RepID=A0A1W1Y1A9_9NEIS|nr:ABC transporter substrate-binding protein [Andreprevotia lacus]SMC29936.1 sulfonate transport system substrate-binding protein [Andreprevotia lacus DSM 23236]